MTKTLIALAILALIIYYYQQRKETKPALNENHQEPTQANQALMAFLRSDLNSNSLEELKAKLAGKTLNEILEANEDYETEVDTLTRTKNSLETDLTAQAEAFQARLREKDREIRRINELSKESEKQLKKLKEDLASEKQQHKGSLERIKLLTEQITSLTKEKNQSVEKLAQITSLVSHWEINTLTKKQLSELKILLKNE